MIRDDRTWILTFTGAKVYPMKLTADQIEIRDIAHSLAMQCRYNGHVRRFFSVAEHCVLMARWAYREGSFFGIPANTMAKIALMHDSAETYITDIPRPVKYQLHWKRDDGSYAHIKEAERYIDGVVSQKFGLPHPWPTLIDEWDAKMLTTERDNLLTFHPDWECPPIGLPVEIECWSPDEAEHQFLLCYNKLWGGAWQ